MMNDELQRVPVLFVSISRYKFHRQQHFGLFVFFFLLKQLKSFLDFCVIAAAASLNGNVCVRRFERKRCERKEKVCQTIKCLTAQLWPLTMNTNYNISRDVAVILESFSILSFFF